MIKSTRRIEILLFCLFLASTWAEVSCMRRRRVTHQEVEQALASAAPQSDFVDATLQTPLKVVLKSDTQACFLTQSYDKATNPYAITFPDWERRIDADGDLGGFLQRLHGVHVVCDTISINREGFLKIIALPNLSALTLIDSSISVDPKVWKRQVSFVSSFGIAQEDFAALGDCHSLRKLKLRRCREIPGNVLSKIVNSQILKNNLSILSLAGCDLEEEKGAIVRSIADYQCLCKLNLNETRVTQDDLCLLSRSPFLSRTLKKLYASNTEIRSLASIAGFALLEEIRLYLGSLDGLSAFEALAQDTSVLPSLRKIILYHRGAKLGDAIVAMLEARGIIVEQEELFSE